MISSLVKRLGYALALAGLLIRLAVAIVYVPAMVSADAAAVALGEGQFKIVYCSLLGTMAIPGTDTDEPDNGPPSPGDGGCPLCQAVSASAFALDAAGYSLKAPLVLVRETLGERDRVAPPSRPIRATARGPPSLHA